MANCGDCKYKQSKPEPVPGHVFEVTVTALQLTIKRLIAVIILLVTLLVASNVAWIIYESQFETISVENSVEAEQEAEGGNNYAVNGDFYGEAEG